MTEISRVLALFVAHVLPEIMARIEGSDCGKVASTSLKTGNAPIGADLHRSVPNKASPSEGQGLFESANLTLATGFCRHNPCPLHSHLLRHGFQKLGAADHEVLAFTAAVGNGECAQLSCAIDTGEARWDRRHAAWWPA